MPPDKQYDISEGTLMLPVYLTRVPPLRTAYCEYSRNVIPSVDPSDAVQPRFMKDLGIVAEC